MDSIQGIYVGIMVGICMGLVYYFQPYIQDQLVFMRLPQGLHSWIKWNKDPSYYNMNISEIHYKGGDNANLYAWYASHPASKGIIIFFHGNFKNVSIWMDFTRRYYDWGYSVFMVEYRGYGKCLGETTEYNMFSDSVAAYKYVTNILGYDPNKTIVSGMSLGGAIAINLGANPNISPPAAVMSDSSFTTMPELMGKLVPFGRFICNFSFNSLRDIAKIEAPILIIHSRTDKLIPFEMGQRLFAASIRSKKKLFLESTGSHTYYAWNDTLRNNIRSFCDMCVERAA